MPWTRPKLWLIGLLLLASSFGTGLVAKTFPFLIDPEQLASQMPYSPTALTSTLCGKGERDYDFICHVRSLPLHGGKVVDEQH